MGPVSQDTEQGEDLRDAARGILRPACMAGWAMEVPETGNTEHEAV